ncbi:MAG: phospholipase D-like domain-containing protein [Bacteroidota bacterium]
MPVRKKINNRNKYTANNEVKLIRGGNEYFDTVLRMIQQAKEAIHLQTYILDGDETGQLIINALKEAAQRRVEVYLILDGYASQSLSKKIIEEIKASGIHFRFFEPLLKSKYFYFGRRLHQKLMVTDTRYAIVGGINITNRYNDMPGKPAWLDFAVFVEGEIAKELCVLCWKTWKGFPRKMGLTPCEEKSIDISIPADRSSLVRIRRNDWVRDKTQISASYIEMLNTAQTRITLLSSYFLPGMTIKKSLVKAVKRGVKIKVVLAGLSDVMVTKYAERYIYDWLLRNNIEIYEYQGNVLHGKLSVCDSKWLTIGSYNINNISAYASIELNLDINDPDFAKEAEETLEDIISKNCIPITESSFKKSTNIFKQFVRWFSYEFIKLALYLFTFYFRKKN